MAWHKHGDHSPNKIPHEKHLKTTYAQDLISTPNFSHTNTVHNVLTLKTNCTTPNLIHIYNTEHTCATAKKRFYARLLRVAAYSAALSSKSQRKSVASRTRVTVFPSSRIFTRVKCRRTCELAIIVPSHLAPSTAINTLAADVTGRFQRSGGRRARSVSGAKVTEIQRSVSRCPCSKKVKPPVLTRPCENPGFSVVVIHFRLVVVGRPIFVVKIMLKRYSKLNVRNRFDIYFPRRECCLPDSLAT